MDGPDIPKNLNTFLEEYLESIGDKSKEIRRDLELIQVLDAVRSIWLFHLVEIWGSHHRN